MIKRGFEWQQFSMYDNSFDFKLTKVIDLNQERTKKNQQINRILSRVCAILRRQAFEVVSKHEN